MLESVLRGLAAFYPALSIALDGRVGSKPARHVAALVRARVRSSGVALTGRMIHGGWLGVIAVSPLAALMRSHVGAVPAVIAIDVYRPGPRRAATLAVGERAESGNEEKQDAVFGAHGSCVLSGETKYCTPSRRALWSRHVSAEILDRFLYGVLFRREDHIAIVLEQRGAIDLGHGRKGQSG